MKRIAAAVVVVAAVLAFATTGVGQPGPGSAHPLPAIGALWSSTEFDLTGSALLGAATEGAPGEAWAIRGLPSSASVPRVGGAPLQFAPGGDNQSQTVFYKYTDEAGWLAAETPADENGNTIRQLEPIFSSASITAHRGGALLARTGGRRVALIRRPGDGERFTVSVPPDDVLLPASGAQPAEQLIDGDHRGPAAAFESEGETALFAAATGRSAETIVFYDGQSWARETIDYPTGTDGGFRILAISATGRDNAWLIAEADQAADRGVLLMRRQPGSDGHWVEQALGSGGEAFAAAANGSLGVSGVRAYRQVSNPGTEPLTATADGVWIDGSLESAGQRFSFAIYFDIGDGHVTGSWCDAPGGACDRPLGVSFSETVGFRSTAWPGPGFGTRVLTNPLDAGGSVGTNRGTYLSLDGEDYLRMPGAGFEGRVSSALASSKKGWIAPSVELSATAAPVRLKTWSVGLRSPLNDVVGEPAKAAGDEQSKALAVGDDGGVSRYLPGSGWQTEFLQTASGLVSRPDLRAVAWPEAARAHAVGDDGAMWLWRAESGLWQRDPGAPIGFETHLMSIAFDPADPQRGYAVGREGTILKYGKSWDPVCAPADSRAECAAEQLPASIGRADIRAVAFSGREAIAVAGSKVLVNGGGGWRVDTEIEQLLASYESSPFARPQFLTVAGLPDGGAFIAGRGGMAIQRDSAGGRWRFTDQPLAGLSVVEAALFREAGKLRAVVSVAGGAIFPSIENLPQEVPNQPPPLRPPLAEPQDGYVLRQTGYGWRDEQRSAHSSGSNMTDKPAKPDPVRGLLVGSTGAGWAVGGNNGAEDMSSQGSGNALQRARVRTAAVFAYREQIDPNAASTGSASPTPITLSSSGVNFIAGGHSVCETRNCSQLAATGIAPDRNLEWGLYLTERLAAQVNGPRFFMHTGGRTPESGDAPQPATEAARFAELLASRSAVPTFAAVSRADSAGGDAAAFKRAFAGFGAPFGGAAAAPGVSPRGGGAGTSTHYSFEVAGVGGRLRVIVIDNSRGTLAASDPYQSPPVASQETWLRDELRAARADAIPAVVVGSRDLNTSFSPKLNIVSSPEEGTRIARLLRDEGASAYFFERDEENRYYRIPAGEADTIPAFGSGTLGYRADPDAVTNDQPSLFFGNTGVLLTNVDVAARDPLTNRAPVSARMIPLIENLTIEAIDGTELRRSRPALFSGLGRRPLAGDRWGPVSGGLASPAGSDSYTSLPVELCKVEGCDTRLEPEYEFHSSDPDIADFIKLDPASSNPRKPMVVAGKVVTDPRSGLLCPFNAGTTTVTISSGGFSYARKITVLPGSVRPPCGTRPLAPARFKPASPVASVPSPPPSSPAAAPLALTLPPVPLPPASKPPSPRPFTPVDEFLATIETPATARVVPPPPAPSLARPIPPTGGMSRVFEEKREEEVATEDSQAFARYRADEPAPLAWSLAALAIAAAISFSSLSSGRGRGGRQSPQPAYVGNRQTNYRRRRP